MLTTRETIINQLLAKLLDQTAIVKVVRGNKSSIEKEFNGLAETDFPVIVVEAGLPQPNIHYSSRNQGVIDEVRSTLNVDVYCYVRCSENIEDGKVSILMNDVWKVICDNPNLGGAIKLIPAFSQTLTYNGPYVYFTISLGLEYIHDNKSI